MQECGVLLFVSHSRDKHIMHLFRPLGGVVAGDDGESQSLAGPKAR